LTLDLALTEPGTWDFSFAEIALANVYSLSFDAELNLYERHLGCGFLFLEYCYNEFPLLGIDIYNGSPFALAFNPIGATPGFSIAVGTTPVPEAGTLSLLAVGLVSLTGLIRSTRGGRRHRR
jgi:hypothetical protein